MKEKIIAALKNKYKNLGFSDKAFDGVAAFLATTTTEEDQIETSVAGVDGLLKGLQGDIDKRVGDAVTKAKLEAAAPKPNADPPTPQGGNEPDKPKNDNAEIPAWAQSILDSNKALAEEVTALKSGKTAESRKQTFAEKLKDVNPILKEIYLENFDPSKFQTDDAFQEFLTTTDSKISEATQKLTDQGLGQQGKPFQPAGSGSNSQAAVKNDIANWAKATEPVTATAK